MTKHKKWLITLMKCIKCGNVNRSDERDCIFHCGWGRVNIEHSNYKKREVACPHRSPYTVPLQAPESPVEA